VHRSQLLKGSCWTLHLSCKEAVSHARGVWTALETYFLLATLIASCTIHGQRWSCTSEAELGDGDAPLFTAALRLLPVSGRPLWPSSTSSSLEAERLKPWVRALVGLLRYDSCCAPCGPGVVGDMDWSILGGVLSPGCCTDIAQESKVGGMEIGGGVSRSRPIRLALARSALTTLGGRRWGLRPRCDVRKFIQKVQLRWLGTAGDCWGGAHVTVASAVEESESTPHAARLQHAGQPAGSEREGRMGVAGPGRLETARDSPFYSSCCPVPRDSPFTEHARRLESTHSNLVHGWRRMSTQRQCTISASSFHGPIRIPRRHALAESSLENGQSNIKLHGMGVGSQKLLMWTSD
jgi:hypothetical protein